MSEEGKADSTFFLKNVRLSFNDLFKAVQFQGAGKFSYRAAFLIEPGSVNDQLIKSAIQRAAKGKWGAKAAEAIKTAEAKGSEKFCYLTGEQRGNDGYQGKMVLASSRPQEKGQPKVIDKNPEVVLTAEDGRIYSGCYVNAKVQIWAQDNTYGKAIRCSLSAVQFLADGESFGGAPPASSEGFESVEEEVEDFA